MKRQILAWSALVLGIATAGTAVLPALTASATVTKSSLAAHAASGNSLAARGSLDGTGEALAGRAGWGVPTNRGVPNGFLTIFNSVPGTTFGSLRTATVSVGGQAPVALATGQFNLGLVPGGTYSVTVAFPGGGLAGFTSSVTVGPGGNVTSFVGLSPTGTPTLTNLTNNMTPTTPAIGYSRVTVSSVAQGTPIDIDNNGTPINTSPLVSGGPSQTVTLPQGPVFLTVVSATTHQVLYTLHERQLLAGINLNLVAGGSTIPTPNTVTFITSAIPLNIGYHLYAADGGVFNFGDAQFHGSTVGLLTLNKPMVGGAPKVFGFGYWLAAADGGVFAFSADFFGSMGGQHLNAPVVGISDTTDDGGYWLAAADGGIFSFGDAAFFGSMGGTRLNQPVTAISGTASGNGYWMAAADGGVFAFGDAQFFGSMGGTPLNKAIDGIVPTADGQGYWMVASDGGIFNYGDAGFYGSLGSTPVGSPVVGMVPTSDSLGYWLVTANGGVYPFGDARFWGSMAGTRLNAPMVFGSPDGNVLPQ